MGKRGRVFLDVACSIDGPVSCRRLSESDASPSLSDGWDTADSQGSRSNMHGNDSGATARLMLTTPNTSVEQADSQRSAFATEMSFFLREEEDLADMSLYLARAVSSARTPDALVSLVNHFLKHGAKNVMLSLKRSGMQSRLLEVLCMVSIHEFLEGYQRLFFRVFAFLVGLSDAGVVCEETLVKFVLQSCQRPSTPSCGSPEAARGPLHWSQRARRTAVALPRPLMCTAELEAGVDALCGIEGKASVALLALRLLLDIVFRQNSNATHYAEVSVILIFARLGGFDVVSSFLQAEECADALHLLEAVTLCEELRGVYTIELQKTALRLVRFIAEDAASVEGTSSVRREDQNAALRVLTNVTGLVPSVLDTAPQENRTLAAVCAAMLTSAETMPDTLAFALCLTTNIVKWEAREKRSEFTSCLVKEPSFLTRVASLTFTFYHAEDTEKHVLAGYYALLLAVLSLCASPELQLRVPVMTAVVNAMKGTEALKKVEEKPMTLIIAILQEFLFFQSSSGSLTKDAFLSMSSIIDDVVKSNGIEVSSDN